MDATDTAAAPRETTTAAYPRDLSAEEVARLLPHRGDILFARQVRLLDPERYTGAVCWEPWSMGIGGHFPSLPVIPGVYLIEAAAQIAGAGMLASAPDGEDGASERIGVLAGVRRCTFSRPALPGRQVVFDILVRRGSGGFAFVQGTASVEGEQVASLDLILAFPLRSQVFHPA